MANPFVDPEVEPTPDLVADALGPAAEGWDALMRALAEAGVSRRGGGSRDGGWLVKAANRARTVAWIAVDGNATTCKPPVRRAPP